MSLSLVKVEQPSLHVQSRAKAMWATLHDRGQFTVSYKVVPFGRKFEHKTCARRIVIFDLRRRTADCLSLETGEACEANSFGKLCSHVLAAYRSMNRATKRVELKEAA